jgi:hypothetical protein
MARPANVDLDRALPALACRQLLNRGHGIIAHRARAVSFRGVRGCIPQSVHVVLRNQLAQNRNRHRTPLAFRAAPKDIPLDDMALEMFSAMGAREHAKDLGSEEEKGKSEEWETPPPPPGVPVNESLIFLFA